MRVLYVIPGRRQVVVSVRGPLNTTGQSRVTLKRDHVLDLFAAECQGAGAIDTLAGSAEAAEIFGVDRTNLRALANLPEPIARLRSGPVWLVRDLVAAQAEREARGR